jgi:membrane protein required for colicin V production
MGWLDILLGLSLALSTIEGIKRGFFHEVAGFVGLVVGFLLAIWLDKPIGLLLSQHAGIPVPLAGVLGFILPFVGTILVAQVAASFLSEIVKSLSLNGLNRLAGGAFALLKSLVILSIVLNIYELFDSDRRAY